MATLRSSTATATTSAPLLPSPRPRRFLPRLSLARPFPPLPLRLLRRADTRRAAGNELPASRPFPADDDRPVPCEVEVVSWRERRIRARVSVYADVEDVWRVLTDYERLANFIPNLIHSGRVECPHEGRIWLEQIGVQRALYWHIEARVVLDLQEIRVSVDERELHFSMVDGDFNKFEGKWSVKAVPRSSTVRLSYEVAVVPKFNFPAMFVERIIRSDLPANLHAVASRAEGSAAGVQYQPASVNGTDASSGGLLGDGTVPMSQKDNFSLEHVKQKQVGLGLGVLPSVSSSSSFSSPQRRSNWGVFGKSCSLDRPCMIDEVHLRRFDGLMENGGDHRGVFASITVKAPASEVWNVLTSYEKLPEKDA